jgi:hypothetical protein
LLIYPLPIIQPAYAVEVTETETFDGTNGAQVTDLGIPSGNYAVDDGDNVAIRNDQNCCGVGGQYFFSMLDNQTSQNANTTGFTFTLPSDHDITEVGFRTAGVNTAYTIQYNYSDSTNETVNYNGQSGATYEDITKSITDKYITSFVITVSDWSGIDTIYWKYDDGLTSGIGPPTNLATTQNLHSGAVGVTWTAPTGYTNTPERYAVAFSNDNFQNSNLAVSTTTDSGDTAYTFSKQYLLSTFTDLEVGDTLYFKIRSDDDTNSLYSSWTDVVTYTIPDVASGVSTLTANQDNQYVGVIFYWTQPNTGWATQTSYKLAYKDSDDTEFTYVTGISADATNYTWTGVLEDTYEFLIYACTQNDSWCHGPQNGSISVDITSTTPTTSTTTTTIVYTLGPPMNPEVDNVYDDGVLVEWDAPNTGNATVDHYELYYRTSADNETKVDNITDTEYTIPYSAIPNGEYTFSLRAISTTNSVNSGYSTEPTLTVFNQKAQDDDDAAAEQAAAQAEADRIAAAVQWERDQNLAETGYSETDAERREREATEIIIIVLDDGSEGEYTQNDVNDGTVERDNQRATNEELYGCYVTDEAIERGDCGNIEIYEEETDTDGEFPTDDDLVLEVADDDEDYEPEEIIYEVYDEDEGWVEVSEEEFEEILEYEAELDAKELEVLETYDLEQLEELNLYIPEDELEGLTEEEILEIEKDFEEFIETIIVIEEYLDEFEDEEWYEPVVILIPEDIDITEIEIVEDRLTPIPEDEEIIIIIEDFPDEGPIEELTELEEILEEELSDDELEVLTEEEYEEYREERKEVIETYVEELEEEILEEVLPETVTVEEFEEIKEKDIEELTEEEVEIVVEVAAEVIEEVVDIEELEEVIVAEEIIILEEEELEELSEEELEAYEEELDEVIEEFVEELETEELVVVVEQIAEVGVENLAVADEQTIKVVQAVVAEVVDVETVEELSEEEVEAVAEVLGFEEEEDVSIIAEVAAKDETVAEAVEEYVERAVENAETENYTLADVVTEVQVEVFLENPVGALIDVNIGEMDLGSIGTDMTSDQRQKSKEVVVPIIIASQIIAQAGALMTRRF